MTDVRARLCALYRSGAFDGMHPDTAHDPDSEAGRHNVDDCLSAIERGAFTLADVEAYAVLRLEGHGPACGLHRGERCTCDALATRKAGAP